MKLGRLFSCFIVMTLGCSIEANVPINSLVVTAGIATAYGLYSTAVDMYAERKIKEMMEVPLIDKGQTVESDDKIDPNVLRSTISKRSNLVVNPNDRRLWNKWLTATPKFSPKLSSGTYGFAYRSYVNVEEKNALACAFRSWHLFNPYTAEKRGQMIVDGKKVTLVDHFLHRRWTPLKIYWHGRLERNVLGKQTIVWTDSEMVFGDIVTKNPPASERLRQIPWKVTKEQDGLVAFQRGDVGMLAYDRERNWLDDTTK